jgi:hypothetical protein
VGVNDQVVALALGDDLVVRTAHDQLVAVADDDRVVLAERAHLAVLAPGVDRLAADEGDDEVRTARYAGHVITLAGHDDRVAAQARARVLVDQMLRQLPHACAGQRRDAQRRAHRDHHDDHHSPRPCPSHHLSCRRCNAAAHTPMPPQ